jgi:hypothetical protein
MVFIILVLCNDHVDLGARGVSVDTTGPELPLPLRFDERVEHTVSPGRGRVAVVSARLHIVVFPDS